MKKSGISSMILKSHHGFYRACSLCMENFVGVISEND